MRKNSFKIKKFIAIIISLFILLQGAVIVSADYVVKDDLLSKTIRVPIPDLYTVKYIISDIDDEIEEFKEPSDLFVDSEGILYVVDTGHNRIIKMTREGEVIKIYYGPEGYEFNKPQGVFVDEDGDLYVADTGNTIITHIDSEGNYIEHFEKPESTLLSDNETEFNPTKLSISTTGYIYIIRKFTLMSIDSLGNFKGFIASSKVNPLTDIFMRIFATKEQKSKIMKQEPESFTNFVIAPNGLIYGTTITASAQIKKLNGIGTNIYPDEEAFGEIVVDDEGTVSNAFFQDIAVDDNGIVTVVEKNTGNLYQYDQEGNNIGVFGGLGDNKGEFRLPVSMAIDGDGYIYVLDSSRKNIQVFEPTRFCLNIHEALRLYHDGRYGEALELWTAVTKADSGNYLARIGIGKALYKEGKYIESMAQYRKARDKDGYSDAFAEYLHDLYRANFGYVVIGLFLMIFLVYKLIKKIKKFSTKDVEYY